MRFEKAIVTSRREFLSNALGTALITASTWPIRAEARSMHRTIRQQYFQLRTCHSKNIPELGRVPGAQHTCHHERFAPRRKRAAVAAYFVNSYF